MRQILLQKGKVSVHHTNPPLIGDHHVLVRVHYSFISSGTESATLKASQSSIIQKYASNITQQTQKIMGALKEHGVAGTLALTQEKLHKILSLGYSCAGQIIAIGSKVEKFRIGDYVSCAGASFAHHADIVSVPQNLIVKITNPDILKYASLTTIGAIALQGIRRAELQLGEKLCVIGLGLLGQLTVQLAKQAGYDVIGIDINDERLALAKQLGARLCLNALTTDVVKEIEFATGHYGVDATIITASADSGTIIQQAMRTTRRKGRVVLVGDVKIEFDREPFYAKEIDFVISCSYGPGRYDTQYEHHSVDYPYAYVRWTENRNMSYFVELLEKKELNLDAIITHEFDINHANSAYEALQKSNSLGVILSYQSDPVTKKSSAYTTTQAEGKTPAIKPYIHHDGILNVSVIGVGGFSKVKILPSLSKIKQTSIHSIIDIDTANALTTARVYKAQRVSNDYRKILGDDDIQVVVIATPHAHHAEQAIACLSAGKAVLVEKPAAVTFEQLSMLKQFFTEHKNSLYSVDFNRSCSPFLKAIKAVVAARTNPLLVTYRMNANYLPKDHWIQTSEHRGRIIGEACHIFELFCFLTDAKPISVMVSSLNAKTDDLLITDNIVATIAMSDGSCCTLAYSSLGDVGIGKEYMEVFFDGKTIAMNDYLQLSGHGLPKSFNRRVRVQDKGHDALFEQFIKAAHSKDAPPPIPLDRILVATELSLIVDKLARSGGGFEYFGI